MNKRKTIKNLIFDVGGVVIFIKKINFALLDRKFKLPAGTIERIIRACSRQAVINKNFNERIFFEKRFPRLLSWKNYYRILLEWFATERLNRWLIRWVERKRKTHRIILLTNYTAKLKWRLEKKFRIAHHFDSIFNSADIGIIKPNRGIFRYLLKNIKAKAGECLFVDDKEINIKTAKKLGFKTILFKNNQQFKKQARKFRLT